MISWQHCYRCDKNFDVPDVDFQGYRPNDAGEWCFQGAHTQNEEQVKQENWDANPGDLVY
jgi:hypothetical protein